MMIGNETHKRRMGNHMTADEVPDDEPVATKEQYRAALLALRDARLLKKMRGVDLLRAHAAAPEHKLTSRQLAAALQMTSFSAANLLYGKFAHAIADQIGYVPPPRKNGEPMWWYAVCLGNRDVKANDPEFVWTLRPEMLAALRDLKWVQ